MIKKSINLVFLFCFVVLPASGNNNTISEIRFSTDDLDLNNAVAITDSTRREIIEISDLTYQNNYISNITDIVLSFNYPSSHLIKDDSNNYNIPYSSYSFIDNNGVLGKGGANFYKSDHRVEVDIERNLWLGSITDLGSFTIEFRFCPFSLKDGSILFSRIGYFSGKKNGFEIVFNDGIITAWFHNMFRDSEGRSYNVFLNKGNVLREERWYHFSLSFDRISGKLVKSLNGNVSQILYVSTREEPFVGVFKPCFASEDNNIAFIGKNYCGYLDEFKISYREIEDLKNKTDIAFRNYKLLKVNNRIPENCKGVITSPVYMLPSTGTMITLFKWGEIIRKNTFIWMEFRIKDRLFQKNNRDLKWYRINNNEKGIYLKKIEDEYMRGKYYQWRAHLIASSDGKNSPSIYDIEMKYMIDYPPDAPIFVEVVDSGDKFVRLKWKKNVEHDILGYKIYYGVISKRYDGIISYINNKRISNEFNSRKNYIELDITNNVIEENRAKDKKGLYDYPVLKNTVLYFFSVSVYDSYKPDTLDNHESGQSKEVSARPFAGSEISSN